VLVFRNKGLIPEAAISTMGVNVKLGENPIGQFGTGLKYAIAIILRAGGSVVVYRGLKRLEFALKTETIRGKEFKIVTMNGRKLGFTDQIGLHWQPWMAYRELASNTRDEGGTIRMHIDGDESGIKGETQIFVRCADIEKAHDERGSVFLGSEPLYSLPGVEVHVGESHHIFYRGIRVGELPKKSKYTWNLTSTQYLTEDRTLLYPSMTGPAIVRGILQSPSSSFLSSVLDADQVKECYENTLPYSNVTDTKPTDVFMDISEYLKGEKRLVGYAGHVYNTWADKDARRASPFNVRPDEEQEATLRTALTRLQDAGIPLDRSKLLFKSNLQLGRVQVAGRETLVVDSSALGSLRTLSQYLAEGAALLQGGNPMAQLANWVVYREWIPKELQDTHDSRAVEDLDGVF
jgi:hypothetical protein